MTSIRLLLVRGSILLNAVLVLYLCLSWLSIAPARRALAEQSFVEMNEWGTKSESIPFRKTLANNNEISFKASNKIVPQEVINPSEDLKLKEHSPPNPSEILNSKESSPDNPSEVLTIKEPPPPPGMSTGERETEYQEPPREVQESAGAPEQPPLVVVPIVEEGPDPPLNSLERKIYGDHRDCTTRPVRGHYTQRGGDFWILNNYIPAAMTFRCDESITYATHGDYTFLDNLDPLTSRWQGPVSVAVYAPGTDFNTTIDTILYLRNCMAEGVKKYVTFHIYFHTSHVPKEVPTTEQLLQRKTNCDKDPPKWTDVTTYRQANKLVYPVNVARNTARENAQTYFHFVSDVELYPSINIIPEFFKMLKRPDASTTAAQRVYVFPIFEVAGNQNAPETKAELQAMLKSKKSIPFHKRICPKCHNQPKTAEWQRSAPATNLSVFHVGKRRPPFHRWEPIFIGTDREPIYDERLSWEGKSDKMSQMYVLCVRDYEFHILDNAFLVHKPGIKKLYRDPGRDKIVARTNSFLKKKIIPEYKSVFGSRKGCVLIS